MNLNEVYKKPESDIENKVDFEFQKVSLLNFKGRMGRLRFFNFSLVIPILLATIPMALSMIDVYQQITINGTGDPQVLANGVSLSLVRGVWIYLVLAFILSLISGVQRFHDLNLSGWFSLLQILPLVTFFLWLIPGNKESNRFGSIAKKNTIWNWLIAFLLLMLLVLILIAIKFQK